MNVSGVPAEPAVTIRAHLRKRARWLLWLSLGGLILAFSTALFGTDTNQQIVVSVGLATCILSIAAMRWIKCPKCDCAVGYQIARPLASPELFGKRPNYCLYCGVSLDEPIP